MKFAGFDIIPIQEKAKDWQYFYVHDGKAELKKAGHLCGQDVY